MTPKLISQDGQRERKMVGRLEKMGEGGIKSKGATSERVGWLKDGQGHGLGDIGPIWGGRRGEKGVGRVV